MTALHVFKRKNEAKCKCASLSSCQWGRGIYQLQQIELMANTQNMFTWHPLKASGTMNNSHADQADSAADGLLKETFRVLSQVSSFGKIQRYLWDVLSFWLSPSALQLWVINHVFAASHFSGRLFWLELFLKEPTLKPFLFKLESLL